MIPFVIVEQRFMRKTSDYTLRTCLHGGGEPQIGEVTCGGSLYLSCKRDQIKMKLYGKAGYPTKAGYHLQLR